MIKAVFFDLYQTLVHYQPSQEELEAAALKSLGIEADAAALRHPILTANEFIYQQIAKKPLSQRSKEAVMALYAEYQRVVLKEAGIPVDEKIILRLLGMMQQAKMDLILFDDVMPALDDLKKRDLKIGLISNIEQNMTAALDKLGLNTRLDCIVTSQDAGFAKPKPEIFRYALNKTSVKPADAVYVGDQYQVDIIGAKGVGIRGILIDRDNYYKEKLDCVKIKSLTKLIEQLK